MRRYKSKKQYSWTSELAYAAGLIASDGCLYNDGRHINLTSKDTDLLDSFCSILKLTTKHKTKMSGYGTLGHYVQFSDVAFYDFLVEARITPAKSKTISQINIPDQYYADFLRGYFDGDGYIYGFWDKRWIKSFMYYTGFVSASPAFLEWLRTTNTRLFGTSRGKIKSNDRAETLLYAKRDSRILFEAMYHTSNIPALLRKKTKIIDLLSTDPYSNIALAGQVLESGRQATLRT